MKQRFSEGLDVEIVCFETEDGLMNLQIDGQNFQLTKGRFIEFSTMVHQVGRLLIDELLDDHLNMQAPLGLEV